MIKMKNYQKLQNYYEIINNFKLIIVKGMN